MQNKVAKKAKTAKTNQKQKQLTTSCLPEFVTLVVAFHMRYRATTFSLTQVIVVIKCKMQIK